MKCVAINHESEKVDASKFIHSCVFFAPKLQSWPNYTVLIVAVKFAESSHTPRSLHWIAVWARDPSKELSHRPVYTKKMHAVIML